jgi:hypothetical protein
MERLHNLALSEAECDVVALTGDCVSQTCRRLPQEWNSWPQALLLSVPGNHDEPSTFDNLHSWVCHPPWVERFDDLIFVGLASLRAAPIAEEIRVRGCRYWEGCHAIVLLSHYRPRFNLNTELTNLVMGFAGARAFLVLHGDEHPSGFQAEWDNSERLGDRIIFRSNVYSSARGRRGLGHRIEWNGEIFQRAEIQGTRRS